MKDRIQKLINFEQLTSAKFADTIGVQRSSISHILSGRNKPSLEFVQKVLSTYVSLNTDWLIFGRGKMYATEAHADLFANIENEIPEIQSFKNTDIPKIESIPPIQIESTIEDQIPKEVPIINSILANSADKKIARIVIFYTDRTFEDYVNS